MSDEPKPAPEETPPAPELETPPGKQDEGDVGDFITRHVLDKDSVFFEG